MRGFFFFFIFMEGSIMRKVIFLILSSFLWCHLLLFTSCMITYSLYVLEFDKIFLLQLLGWYSRNTEFFVHSQS